MKCPEYLYLSRFYDEELDEDESVAVGSHLDRCECCSTRLSQLKAVDRAVKELESPPLRVVYDGRRWLWKVATLAALIAVAFLLYPSPSSSNFPSSEGNEVADSQKRTYEFASKEAEYTVVVEGEATLLSLEMGDVRVIYENE